MGQYSYCRKLGPRFISGIAQASGKKNNVLKGFYCLSKVEGRECHINRLNSVPSMNDSKFPRNRPRTGHDEVPVGGVPCWSGSVQHSVGTSAVSVVGSYPLHVGHSLAPS